MDWSDIIEYMSMSDEDFAYEAGLTKEKVKKALEAMMDNKNNDCEGEQNHGI